VLGIADLLSSRPWAVLGANLAAAVVAIAASLGAPGDLGIGSTQLDDRRPETLIVVLERDGAAGASALAVARDVVASQLEADPAIGAVRVVDDERRSVLLGDLEPTSAATREDAVERLSQRIDPGALRATVGGETAALIEAKRVLGEDLWRLELLVLPLVLLLALVAVGPRVAVAPVVCTVIAIAGSAALLRLIGVVFDVSLLGVVPAFAIGAVLGVEMPALVVRLYREEATISPEPAALRYTVARAGPLLAGAAGAGSLPALALLATPLEQSASLALGCALAAALAAASALTATPAAIAIFGGRGPEPERAEAEGEDDGKARRLAETIEAVPGFVASSRLRCGLVALAALVAGVAIAYPALDGSSRPFIAADLPPASEVARASGLAATQGGGPEGSLFGELPLVAAIAAALLAVAVMVATRRPGTLVAVPFALLPAAAGLGACVYVLDQGHLAEAMGGVGRGIVDSAAVAAATAALAALGASRAMIALQVVRAERRLGIDPGGAAQLAAGLALPGGAAAALAGAAASAVLVASDLAVAREFGLAVGAGLLVDLVLVRIPLLAALARTAPPTSPSRPRSSSPNHRSSPPPSSG
jgi:uncharacterized membrane protein YdfJ with MMPL/SSD domain